MSRLPPFDDLLVAKAIRFYCRNYKSDEPWYHPDHSAWRLSKCLTPQDLIIAIEVYREVSKE